MPSSHDFSQPPDNENSAEIDVPSVGAELVAHACVAVVGGNEAGRVFALINRETVIGRAPAAHIRIDDGAISSKHAIISWDGSQHTLTDLGSTNGTFLNGERLVAHQPTVLNFGDSIQVADIVLAYLEARRDETAGHTHQLALIAPQLQMPAPNPLNVSERQIIAQLLQSAGPVAAEPKGASLEEQIDKLLKVVAFLRRNWVPIFAAAALCALIGTVSAFLNPPPTEATTRIRMRWKSSEGLQQERASREDLQQFFTTAEQNFLSQSLVESTLKELDGEKPDRGYVQAVLQSLKFDSVAYGTYEGVYQAAEPEWAHKYLSAHLKNYLASEVQRTIQGTQAEVEFLSSRLKENEAELRKTEEELRAFKSKHLDGLPDFAKDHIISRETLTARRAELAGLLERTNLELGLAKKRLAEETPLLQRRVESSAPYEQSLIEAKRKLGEAQAKGLGPQHPEVVSLQRQVTELQRMADQARRTEASTLEREANPGLVALRHRVGDLEVASRGTAAELGQVNGQIARIDAIVTKMPEVEATYAQLTRTYDSNREMHAKLFERLRQSQLQLELERSSAKARYEVIAPPEASGVPLRKALLMRTVIGIVLGLGVGLGIAVVMELRRFLRRRRKPRSTAIVRV